MLNMRFNSSEVETVWRSVHGHYRISTYYVIRCYYMLYVVLSPTPFAPRNYEYLFLKGQSYRVNKWKKIYNIQKMPAWWLEAMQDLLLGMKLQLHLLCEGEFCGFDALLSTSS
jgi:hypothetical protein